MFSVKDSLRQSLRSRVVYKLTCAGYNARYIGETTRHICTRVGEHQESTLCRTGLRMFTIQALTVIRDLS